MESEKVENIKKALEETIDGKLSTKYLTVCEISCCPRLDIDRLFADILTLINELESENEKLKNEYLTQARLLGQMGYNDIQECKKLKDRIAELEKENGKLNIELDKRDCIDYPCRLIEKEYLKQFAEILKEKVNKDINTMYVMRIDGVGALSSFIDKINETLKQMLGEE